MSFLDPDCIIFLGVAIFFDILGVIFWILQFLSIEISEIFEYILVDIPPLIIIGAWMLIRNQDIQRLKNKAMGFRGTRQKIAKVSRKMTLKMFGRRGGIKILGKFLWIFLGEFMPGTETIFPWPAWTITVWQTIREGEEATNEVRSESKLLSQTLKRRISRTLKRRIKVGGLVSSKKMIK